MLGYGVDLYLNSLSALTKVGIILNNYDKMYLSK